MVSPDWLGWGHTTEKQFSFTKNTKLCGAILTEPQNIEEDGFHCQLPDGAEVNFYQVVPLYQEELEYKMAHGADALIGQMTEADFVVRPDRSSVC